MVDSVAEILLEILRAFTQISEVLVQKCLAEFLSRTPKQNLSRTPKQNPLAELKQNPLAEPKQNPIAERPCAMP